MKNRKNYWMAAAAATMFWMTGIHAEEIRKASASTEITANLKEQQAILEKLLKNAENGFKKGTIPAETIWRFRQECDQIRIMRLKPADHTVSAGATGALLRWKAAEWRAELMKRNYSSGQLSEERMLLAQWRAKSAWLDYLRLIPVIRDFPRFRQAAAKIINYPAQPVPDSVLQDLVRAEIK